MWFFFDLFYQLSSVTYQKILPWFPPKNWQVKNIAHTHNTQHNTQKLDEPLPPYPSGFALYLHGNICHGPKSWCRSSPQVCCRHLAVGLLSLRLVPLVRMPNKDTSKNREGEGSVALGAPRWVVRHINQLIVGSSDRRDDGEDVRPRWSVWGGCFSYFGAANRTTKKLQKKIWWRP